MNSKNFSTTQRRPRNFRCGFSGLWVRVPSSWSRNEMRFNFGLLPTSQGTNTHQYDFNSKKSKREGVGTKPSDTNVNPMVSALMCVCMHDAVDGRICLNIYDKIFTVNVNTCC